MKNKSAKWWGTFNVDPTQMLFWEIGPLLLGIERFSHEWRIVSDFLKDADSSNLKIATPTSPGFDKKNLIFKRFAFHQTTSAMTLTPVLADRAQVSRPEEPFYLPAKEHTTLYISSPAWIRLEAGPQNMVLHEIPTLRLSDTWYGPNTFEGDLCYASQTFCRTQLTELPRRPYRVVTPVKIYNNSASTLPLEQLSLPLPFLSIFADEHGALWTEEIIVKHENHQEHSVTQSKGAPKIAHKAVLVSSPRLALKSSNLMTMFYHLLTE